MSVMRLNSVLRLTTLALAAIVMTMATSFFAPSAHAGLDLDRFWVDGGSHVKKKSTRKAAYKASSRSKKSYANSSRRNKSAAKRKKLGGYAVRTEKRSNKNKGVRVAALGDSYYPKPAPKKSLSGGGVNWTASSGCLNGQLKAIIYQVAANYGPLRVNSTCRSKRHNRAVGGAPRSQHLTGNAVDFRVFGNTRAVYAFLRQNSGVGGLKHYGGGLFHIDTGPRRTW